MESLRLVLVGIGGFAETYVRALLDAPRREGLVLAGAADPRARASASFERLTALGVPVFDTLEAFYAANRADLAVICSPIQFHEAQSVLAMERGSDVLLEKPIAATAEAARRILAARDRTGRRLAIGYQWCYDPAMLRLKRDVDAGALGKPLRMRALVLWPRGFAYYSRGTGWAGKRYDAEGRPVFDNILSNATAHYLANMLWLAGPGYGGRGAENIAVETARANRIETFDTAVLRARPLEGPEMLVAVSHAVAPEEMQDPLFEYAFERGTVRYGGFGQGHGDAITVRMADGGIVSYGESDRGNMDKLWAAVDMARGGTEPPCPGELGLRHAEAMDAARAAEPHVFLPEDIEITPERVWVPGFRGVLLDCYERRVLPGERPGGWGA